MKMRRPMPIASLVLALLAGQAQAEIRVLRCGALIDGRSDRVVRDVGIRIDGDRIVGVGPFRAGSEPVVDRSRETCLPGLIDAHVHPLIAVDDYQVDHLRHSSAYKALRGLKVVQEMLQAGWTTIRIMGDADVAFAHLDVRRAIDEGMFLGPRITGAGHYLSITGGGGDLNFAGPEQRLVSDGLVVDGVDNLRRAVREEVKNGSDWIKVLASGAMMSAGNDPKREHYSPDELRAIVAEAGRLGVPVAMHAHSTQAIKSAILAGARSVEHGTFIDDEGIKLMVTHGTWLVPTLYVGDYYLNDRPDSLAQRKLNDMTRLYRAQYIEALRRAHKAGVKIGVGSDYVGFPVRFGMRELRLLTEAGLTPMQAIQAASRGNSELLGWQDRIGTVESGKLADIIAVPGDPLTDLALLERVSMVMLGGRLIGPGDLAPRLPQPQ